MVDRLAGGRKYSNLPFSLYARQTISAASCSSFGSELGICMRIFVFVFATANLILDLLWCGVKLEALILKDSPQNHMSLIVSYGLMAFVYCFRAVVCPRQ